MNHNLIYALLAVVVILSVVNLATLTAKNQSLSAALIAGKENTRPADLSVIKLADSNCKDCFNIDNVLSDLKSKNVKVISEETIGLSDRSKELARNFRITKLPTLIVSGEVKKPGIESLWKNGWELKSVDGKEYAVYTNTLPPFVSTETGEVIGRVSVTHIVDSTCQDCQDLFGLTDFLRKQAGVVFSENNIYEYNSPDGVTSINRFNIQRIPAVVFSRNILEYPSVREVWASLNVTEKNGFFALHAQTPPYRDTKSGELSGFVSVIYLTDNSCKNCYNVSINKQIVSRFLAAKDEKTVDLNSTEGAELVEKYRIEKLPIILLSPDAKEYAEFSAAWEQVGSVEGDGWFVMRKPEILGSYKDLTTKSEVVIQREAAQPAGSGGHG